MQSANNSNKNETIAAFFYLLGRTKDKNSAGKCGLKPVIQQGINGTGYTVVSAAASAVSAAEIDNKTIAPTIR